MWDKIVSFIDALILHVFLLAILLFGVTFSSLTSPKTQKNTVVNTLVDSEAVLTELERLKREEEFKNSTLRTQQYVLEEKKIEYEQFVIQEHAHLETLEQQQQQEKQELEVLKQQRQVEKKKLEPLQRELEQLQ